MAEGRVWVFELTFGYGVGLAEELVDRRHDCGCRSPSAKVRSGKFSFSGYVELQDLFNLVLWFLVGTLWILRQ